MAAEIEGPRVIARGFRVARLLVQVVRGREHALEPKQIAVVLMQRLQTVAQLADGRAYVAEQLFARAFVGCLEDQADFFRAHCFQPLTRDATLTLAQGFLRGALQTCMRAQILRAQLGRDFRE